MTRLLPLLLLSSCALPGEWQYQTAHAIDSVQTYKGMESNCFQEVNYINRAIIGAHPDNGSVITWALVQDGLHWAVSEYLYYHGSTKAYDWWQVGSQVVTWGTVLNNERIGMSIMGAHCDY